LVFTAGVLILLGGPFFSCMAIGARLGTLFEKFRPVTAYSINLLGALLGTVMLAGLSFLNIQPGALLSIPCIVLLFFLPSGGKTYKALAVAALIGCALFGSISLPVENIQTFWSPYERIDFVTRHVD